MASSYSGTNDNAAGRLWKVLTAAQPLNGGQTHAQLARAFGLEGSDTLTVVRALTLAVEAVDEIEWRVKRMSGVTHDLFLDSIKPVREAFLAATQNYDFNQWKGSHLRPEYLKSLLFCSDLLSKHYPEKEIEQDELLTLTKVLNELYESILASQIDDNLRLIILEQLQNIQQSIREYRVKGVYVLKKALSTATGQIILHSAEFQTLNKSDGALLQKFVDMLAFLDRITSIATKSKELLSPLLPVLLPYLPPLLEAAAKHAH